MKFQNLKIENFLTIGKIHCRLDDKGLVLIMGENKDDTSQSSNGAGKSSVADALSFVLYGVTARGETGDAVVNRTAKKDCLVSVDVLEGDSIYRILRHRKHKTEKNRLMVLKLDDMTGAIIDLTKGTDKLTQELVNQIIGCSAEVFNAAIYAGQEKMPDLPGMTDKQLKLLVEEAAGIDRLQQAEVEAKNRLRDLKSEFAIVATEIEAARRAQLQAEASIENTKNDIAHFTSQNNDKLKLKTEQLRQIKSNFEALKKQEEANEPLMKATEDFLVEIYKKLDGAQVEKDQLAKLNDEVRKCDAELTKQKAMVSHQIQVIEKQKRAMEGISNRVGEPCGECGKPYKASDLKDARTIAEKNLSDSKEVGRKLSEQVKALAVSAQEALQAKVEYEQSMTDYSAENKRIDALRSSKNAYLQATGQYMQKARELKQIASEIRQIKEAKNPYLVVLEREQDRLKQIEADLLSATNKQTEIEVSLRVKEQVCKVFGAAGVRAYILDTVTPFLNSRTAHYLSVLTDGNIQATWTTLSATKKGEIREKFTIDVNSMVGAASFKGLSGGEKRKVRLACSMALQDLVSSRASKPIELYVADEIDHALDEAGLERLMSILDEKAKSKGTVLVISHTDLSDWIRQQVSIVKESGLSVLQGSALA